MSIVDNYGEDDDVGDDTNDDGDVDEILISGRVALESDLKGVKMSRATYTSQATLT